MVTTRIITAMTMITTRTVTNTRLQLRTDRSRRVRQSAELPELQPTPMLSVSISSSLSSSQDTVTCIIASLNITLSSAKEKETPDCKFSVLCSRNSFF